MCTHSDDMFNLLTGNNNYPTQLNFFSPVWPPVHVISKNGQQPRPRGHKLGAEQQQFIPCEDSAEYSCSGFCPFGVRCRPTPGGCTCGASIIFSCMCHGLMSMEFNKHCTS